jgi:hypothetical protein
MSRETTKPDIQAYLSMYVKSNLRKLAKILYPKLERSYFESVAKTLQVTKIYRNIICAHLGKVMTAEIVSEMADFLVQHKRTSWVFCTGRFKDHLILSIRTTNTKAEAGRLIKKMVSTPNTVGGHEMMAGGYVPLQSGKEEAINDVEQKLTDKFVHLMGYTESDWKPLIQ